MKRIYVSIGAALTVWILTQSIIFSACSALVAMALQIELEHRRRAKLHDLVKRNWGEVIDSLSSAASAGLSPTEAFADLAQIGPVELRQFFEDATEKLDRGDSLEQTASWLKLQLADAHSDRTLELIRLSHELGASAYLETLKNFGSVARNQIALDAELAAKQGWIMGTAKLAVASPWAIVLMLSIRPENAAIYNSPAGIAVLFLGLAVCLIAYRLINAIGRTSAWPRIFAS